MEESNSSQHTKQTYIYIYIYILAAYWGLIARDVCGERRAFDPDVMLACL